jgi:hypothetical protein
MTTRLRAAGLEGPGSHEQVSRTVSEATDGVTAGLDELLRTDVDAQRVNPLQVIREVTARAGEVLTGLGVPAAKRDEVEERAMPADLHGLGPLAWRDLGEEVHDAGILWGAWKAATVLTRRRAEGKI